MKKTLFFLVLSVSLLASAQQINSFYGYKFGSTVKEQKLIELKSVGMTGTPFVPKKRFRNFNRYLLLVTPKSLQIAGVMLSADFKTVQEANRERDFLISFFEKKYNGTAKDGIIVVGDSLICVTVPFSVTDGIVMLFAVKKEFWEKMTAEIKEKEMEKTDDSML